MRMVESMITYIYTFIYIYTLLESKKLGNFHVPWRIRQIKPWATYFCLATRSRSLKRNRYRSWAWALCKQTQVVSRTGHCWSSTGHRYHTVFGHLPGLAGVSDALAKQRRPFVVRGDYLWWDYPPGGRVNAGRRVHSCSVIVIRALVVNNLEEGLNSNVLFDFPCDYISHPGNIGHLAISVTLELYQIISGTVKHKKYKVPGVTLIDTGGRHINYLPNQIPGLGPIVLRYNWKLSQWSAGWLLLLLWN